MLDEYISSYIDVSISSQPHHDPTPAAFFFAKIAHATARRLSDVKGISEAKVMKLKEIVKSMVPMDFKTAADALEDRKYVTSWHVGK